MIFDKLKLKIFIESIKPPQLSSSQLYIVNPTKGSSLSIHTLI